MPRHLDLTILDPGVGTRFTATARCDEDVAITHLDTTTTFSEFSEFCANIRAALLGRRPRPTPNELVEFGNALQQYLIQKDFERLYHIIQGSDHLRINLISDSSGFASIPWEYMQEPGKHPGPRLERSVVRIVPTIGISSPPPPKLGEIVRLLHVSAEPNAEDHVSWEEVRASILSAFERRLGPDRLAITAVDGANIKSVSRAIAEGTYDIFHFSGHGIVDEENGGHLVLAERGTGATENLSSLLLSQMLGGRGFRLVVLSACETANGDFSRPFSVIAKSLVERGIPAVVANQFPLPDKSAAVFSEGLYLELLQSGDIDRAVNAGRMQLLLQLEETKSHASLEWGIPILYRRFRNSQIYTP